MVSPAARIVAFFLLGLALSACASATDRALKNSPDYKAGYSGGCASANRGNRAYSAGWDTGFHACGISQSSRGMPSMPGQGPIPDPNPHPF
jgi:hypothetical protein